MTKNKKKKRLWPPHSPDLDTCNFYLWGACYRRVYINNVHTEVNMIQGIQNVAFHQQHVNVQLTTRMLYAMHVSEWKETIFSSIYKHCEYKVQYIEVKLSSMYFQYRKQKPNINCNHTEIQCVYHDLRVKRTAATNVMPAAM